MVTSEPSTRRGSIRQPCEPVKPSVHVWLRCTLRVPAPHLCVQRRGLDSLSGLPARSAIGSAPLLAVAVGERTRRERYLACVAAPPTVSVLRLDPAASIRRWEDGRYQRTLEHHFLDFLIDGRSLRDITHESDMVTPLSRPWLEDVPTEVERLLGRRETDGLSAGRAALLVCRVDGDIACGAVTARIHITDAHVGWTDWLWENDFGGSAVENDPGDLLSDRAAYEAELAAAVAALREMPYDELAHRGKRFLWPWEWGWRMPPREE